MRDKMTPKVWFMTTGYGPIGRSSRYYWQWKVFVDLGSWRWYSEPYTTRKKAIEFYHQNKHLILQALDDRIRAERIGGHFFQPRISRQ